MGQMKRTLAIIIVLVGMAIAAGPAVASSAPPLKVTPKQINFGTPLVGEENLEGVTITNRSSEDLLLLVSPSRLPDDFGFGLLPGSTCPVLGFETLAARESCDAVVRFTPSEFFAGLHQTGELIVTAIDPATG